MTNKRLISSRAKMQIRQDGSVGPLYIDTGDAMRFAADMSLEAFIDAVSTLTVWGFRQEDWKSLLRPSVPTVNEANRLAKKVDAQNAEEEELVQLMHKRLSLTMLLSL